MKLNEDFWYDNAHLSSRELHEKYPERYDNDANWRRQKRDAKKKFPWIFEANEAVPPAIPEDKHHRVYMEPVTSLMLGFIGDTHGGSESEKTDELNTFYDICVEQGVTDVLHTGDITAGDRVYPGQMYEIKVVGCDAQAEHVERLYPQRRGIRTHFITGNHDYSHWRHAGVDVGKMIASRRPDMNYLGLYGATLELSPGFTVRLVHPNGGVAYARSYKRQKLIENIPGGKKPRVLIAGHDHQAMWFDYRNVEAFGTGCFEGQSKFLERMGIDPIICGWIAEVKLDENGAIRRMRAELIKFYEGY